MDLSGLNWTLIKFVGPIVLLAALAWAILRNRASRQPHSKTEEGARRVYEQEERARKSGDDGADSAL